MPRDLGKSVKDAFADFVDRARGGHAEQQALLVVVVEQRMGGADEHLEALVDGLGVVVGPPPPGQPMQQLLLGNLQVDRRVQRRAELSQLPVSRSSIIATTTSSGTSSPESR